MFLKLTTAAAALIAASAIAGAASAQNQTDATSAAQSDASTAAAAPAASSTATATDTSGYNVGTPQTDPNTGAQIVTNGPVPDTAANRGRFGKPDSHAGRRTSPAGN